MATCKDCFHSYICFNSEGETKYYGKDLACGNVEQLCTKYKRKASQPLTCKDCLHHDACTDMLEALGFKVAGDGYLADERCRTFKKKSAYLEVVHGQWLFVIKDKQASIYVCSECNRSVIVTGGEDKIKEQLIKKYPYCHCGAKMYGGNEDD